MNLVKNSRVRVKFKNNSEKSGIIIELLESTHFDKKVIYCVMVLIDGKKSPYGVHPSILEPLE